MTTIAYHHDTRTIAVDSRETSGSFIVRDNFQKVHHKDGTTLVLAGDSDEVKRFCDSYPNTPPGIKSIAGFIAKGGEVRSIACNEGEVLTYHVEHNEAYGSGGTLAIAAMDHGKNAQEAVKYAATRDTLTGGRIRTVKVNG